MVLNEYGQIAYHEWLKTPAIRPNVSLDVFVVMPNHIHAVFVIVDESGHAGDHQSPPNALLLRGEQPAPFHSPSRTVGAVVRGYKGAVTKQFHSLGFNGKIWLRDYHDHIIQTAQSYQNISDYVINNPKKWVEDRFHSI